MRSNEGLPKYNVAIVEEVVLKVAAELHPERLTEKALVLKIVGDPEDLREVETATRAIANLREVGLFADRYDEVVEPTPAALRACALLV